MAKSRSTVTMTTEIKGPFWKAGDQMEKAAETAERDTAEEAEGLLKSYLGTVLKNPSGAYVNKIRIQKRGTFTALTDSGIVYGPVLEYGFRRRPTRFKGYTAFRRTRRKVATILRKRAKAAAAAAAARLN